VPIRAHVRDVDQADEFDDGHSRWPWWRSVGIGDRRDVDGALRLTLMARMPFEVPRRQRRSQVLSHDVASGINGTMV